MRNFDNIAEREALGQLKAGQHAAFDYFYHKYKAPIYANILRLAKSQELAADLLQDVFVKVWQNRSAIDAEKDFQPYVYTIAQNTVYDFFRKASHQVKLREQLILASRTIREENPVEESLFYRESLHLLQDGIDRLPPQCRRVFQICKLEGKSYEEAAALLGISIPTVNNHIVKATKILKRYLSYGAMTLLSILFLA